VRAAVPWLAVLLAVLVLLTYVPWISLVLPRTLGL
jgi:C4-dicarboxylate transporter DctM subunit